VPHQIFGNIKMPGIVPKFRGNPGEVKRFEFGRYNAKAYGELPDIGRERLVELQE
jgi:hypothetical protein